MKPIFEVFFSIPFSTHLICLLVFLPVISAEIPPSVDWLVAFDWNPMAVEEAPLNSRCHSSGIVNYLIDIEEFITFASQSELLLTLTQIEWR